MFLIILTLQLRGSIFLLTIIKYYAIIYLELLKGSSPALLPLCEADVNGQNGFQKENAMMTGLFYGFFGAFLLFLIAMAIKVLLKKRGEKKEF